MFVKLLKPLSFIPAILMMYVIFCFSAQDAAASSNLSYKVSYTVVEAGNVILDADLQPAEISSLATRFNGVIRKIAHMTEYFALAVAVSFPLYVYGLHGLPLMFVAGLFCVVFACGDEYHQSFVDGRSPAVRDVLIDSFGVFWGIVLVRIIGWTGRKTIFRPFSKKKKRAKEEAASARDGAQNLYMGMPTEYQDPHYGAPYGSQAASQYHSQSSAAYGPQTAGQYRSQDDALYYGPQAAGSRDSRTSAKKKRQNNSDRLSEDMSLKNLIRNLREGEDK